MNGVFACTLEEILGAVQGIQDPEPLRLQRLAFRELLLGRFFTEQSPVSLGKRS